MIGYAAEELRSPAMYLVGGAVRDALLGIEPLDYDYVVVADTIEDVARQVSLMGATIVHIHERFGCIKARFPKSKQTTDFVIARKDGQYDTKHKPTCIEPTTLLEDLSRRDFTMNAIAVCQDTKTVIDPFGGVVDVSHRTLRCVGDARERFLEDPLRLVRALRFIITKDLVPDETLKKCLVQGDVIDSLLMIPADRIRVEIQRCFDHDSVRTMQTLLEYHDLTNIILSKIKLTCKSFLGGFGTT
jgi:tRNA nucleotidyltransferase (CCA-adding enzyme)